MIILIPAYEPDRRLLELINSLTVKCSFPIVIVDDGSSENFRPIFQAAEEMGCTVLRHVGNQGKGAALKTGFAYIKDRGETEGVVCADCDGQHVPEDIIQIAREIQQKRGQLILGSRRFTGKVPFRSRFGNTVTRMIFGLVTGTRVADTQTGLRGYSADMLDWLMSIPGERFEYEMIMLLEAPEASYKFHEVPIDTVYLQKNKSSHFHPLKDSARVYLPILKFCTSSFLSGILDFILLMVLGTLTDNLLLSVISARVCSSVFNYSINKNFVFYGSHTRIKSSVPKYFGLVALILALNYLVLTTLHTSIGIPLFYSKLLTEAILFVLSYSIQRFYVFRPHLVNQDAKPDRQTLPYSLKRQRVPVYVRNR